MNTKTLKLTPPKMIATAINLSILTALVVLANNFFKSPPIIAKEVRLAQGSVESPLVDNTITKEDSRELTI